MNTLPKRKPNRLPNYSYNENGAYFITICTKDKKHYFWNNWNTQNDVQDNAADLKIFPQGFVLLSKYGLIVENEIKNIGTIYPEVNIEKYVIMPNHIHMIITIDILNGRPQVAPTISRIVQQFKGVVSKKNWFFTLAEIIL